MDDETKNAFISEGPSDSSQSTQKIGVPQEVKLVKEAEIPVEAPQQGTMTVTSGGDNSTVNNVTVTPAVDKIDKDTWLNNNIAPLMAILILIASFCFFAYVLNFDFSEQSKLKDIVILLVGIVSTLITTVTSYYFGSSHGSSAKSKFIHKLNNK